MILYDYFRSSASYRVRIALNLKQLPYTKKEVHLVNNGGEQHSESYKSINPQELVPALDLESENKNGTKTVLTQSLSIIEYLEATYPPPKFTPLLPKDPIDAAFARSIAQTIACDIHPVNNLRVLQYLTNKFEISEEEKQTWYSHWVIEGFRALEKSLNNHSSNRTHHYCVGNYPSIADLCLIPQIYNAKRFHISLDDFPIISSINDHCQTLKPFQLAHPDNKN